MEEVKSFLKKITSFLMVTLSLTTVGFLSAGPILGILMALIVWGMFFSSMGMLGLLVVGFAIIGAFMNGFSGDYPDGMPRRNMYGIAMKL